MKRIILMVLAGVIGLVVCSGVGVSAPGSSDARELRGGVQPRVVGGDPVPDGKYRYIAALLNKNIGGGPARQLFCGGTLIDRDSVLTAAHCVAGRAVKHPGRYRVLLGRARLDDGGKGVSRGVKRIFRHPKFSFPNHDAAVLELGRPVGNIPRLRLAPVSSGNRLERPGTSATVAGWGAVNNRPTYPVRMQELVVPIVGDAYAQRVWPGKVGLRFFPKNMVAAGKAKGENACFGDSGGPLIKKVKRNGKVVPYQIGIVSGGSSPCAQKGAITGYAEVNSPEIAPFIRNAASK